MAVFEIHFGIGHMMGGEQRELDGLVDTDRMFAEIPAVLLRELGIDEEDSNLFELPSGEYERRGIGFARLTLVEKSGPMLVVFSPDTITPVLGKHSLLGVALEADPESQRLVPARLRMHRHPRLVSKTPIVGLRR